jgi:hypothetical protein
MAKVIRNLPATPAVETDAMKKTARRELLPGVSPAQSPPHIVFQSRTVVVRARRRALLRDVLDLLLLLAVDVLFVRFPQTHVPLMARNNSLILLLVLNAALLAYVWFARALPRWRARRVASTWNADERGWFSAARLR